MTWRSKPHRDLCEGAACINCGRINDTVIPAHRNEDKGMGIKVSDAFTVPLCFICHLAYDQPKDREQARASFDRWHSLWCAKLIERGILVRNDGTIEPEPLPKILPRRLN